MSRVTLKDIAELAGVSTAAISQALNDRGNLRPETRDRIKAVAAELGYIPNKVATALRRGSAMSIGFVMADDIDDDTARRWALQRTRQLNALVRASAEHDFTVTVIPQSRPDLVGGAHVDVLYMPDGQGGHDVLRAAAARGIPIVADDLYVDTARGVSIRTGYDSAVRCGVELLADTGAERIAFLVDEGSHPRDEIGTTAFQTWSTVRGRTPLVVTVDTGRRTLARTVREVIDGGADAIFAFCEEGPDIYLQLEARDLVIPRDVQLVALCTTECALNERLGVTHVCVHPELAGEAMFAALPRVDTTDGPVVVDLPWELVRGSTTR
ncbi:LacI family DNA-binding transcriptional regulator [Microbacterium invictum]|uniref:DNA-binding LacI/PurR family transcriptional regulator n=1 Tax=Microbacterium invictum TaxID=515415 RepID=A0AA40VLU1_9MICO|nr:MULTISPECIES: LacI family DNA-binding transcriptional regulator [Microbacterium]MBB4138633.1 DNA-binding LacI/PurR family transcriptional regulator [Microbacterium invictum]